jgi:hypothetical protein
VKETVARLKQAADALDAATTASKETLTAVARAKRAVNTAKKNDRVLDVPRLANAPRKRRPKTTA